MMTSMTSSLLGHVKSVRFLPEVVRDQLEEAGWAWRARHALLSDKEQPLFALERQEQRLLVYISALRCAYSPRLEQRLTALLNRPGTDTPERAFVAAFLLLRMARASYETKVVDAWHDAEDDLHIDALADALHLAGMKTPQAFEHAIRRLKPDDSRRQIQACRLLSNAHAPPYVRKRWAMQAHSSPLLCIGMASGWIDLDAAWVAQQCVDQGVANTCDALDGLLAQHAPQVLNLLTRKTALYGKAPSWCRLATLAAHIPESGPSFEHDWALIQTWLRDDETKQDVLAALPLTGRLEAAALCLEIGSATHTSFACRQQAAHSLLLLTDIEISTPADDEAFLQAPTRTMLPEHAIAWDEAAAAWRQKSPTCRLAAPILLARPRDLDALFAARPQMSIAQWHTWLMVIGSRSEGKLTPDPDALLARQDAELLQRRHLVDQALFLSSQKPVSQAFEHQLLTLLMPQSKQARINRMSGFL